MLLIAILTGVIELIFSKHISIISIISIRNILVLGLWVLLKLLKAVTDRANIYWRPISSATRSLGPNFAIRASGGKLAARARKIGS